MTPASKLKGAELLLRLPAAFALLILLSFNASGQIQSCFVSSQAPPVLHAEGLAEPASSIILICSGGILGSTITPGLILQTSANITNRLDANGNPTGISVTINSGGGAVPTSFSPQLLGARSLLLNGVQYAAAASPTIITISGLYVAIGNPSPPSGAVTTVTTQISAIGLSLSGNIATVILGVEELSLLDSLNDNGIPCIGSPLPTNTNFAFNDLIAAGTEFSTLRVTEAFASAFLPQTGTADTGTRILVSLSGYGSGTNVYVPDAIVGNTGTIPTSAGDYATTVSAGVYTPNSNQLLLIRVNNADVNGAGGTLAFTTPVVSTAFTGVTQIPLTNGAGYAVYEVADGGNLNVNENAQIPVFVGAPATTCPSTAMPNVTALLAPVSTVSVATMTDPIPRFLAVPPALDCTQIGDCGAAYFPVLVVSPTSLILTGSALGAVQNSSVVVGNGGGGLLLFTPSITYQSGSNWLSVTSTTVNGTGNATINLAANPGSLQQGSYQATLAINAGVWGTQTVPVSFTVGPQIAQLSVSPLTIALSGASTGAAQQSSFKVSNSGAGQLSFTTSIAYGSGTNWLSVTPTSGGNAATVTVTANPAALMPGMYQATITLNAGVAGMATVAVTFTVGTPPVTIQSVVNSANLQPGAITANSYATIFGLSLAGTNVQVTFDNAAGTVIFDDATQINLLVPALGSATTASVVATVDGQMSAPFTVNLTQNAPSVFNPGILNQDNSVNLTAAPASLGSYIQIFLTGLTTPVPSTTPVTVTIGSATGLVPTYAGASSIVGLEQVNVLVPTTVSFTNNSSPLSVCIAGSCSAPVNLYLH